MQNKLCYSTFFLIPLILILCYANSFHVPWQFDDPPNISNNYPLHIDNLQPETLWKTFSAQPFAEGQFYRPIANLSFALNWYFGQDTPFGYHLVNLLVHILTAIFLYKTTLLLLRSFSLKKYSKQAHIFIALLSTVLWAINPIQTQAVSYIVQRMASMGAMFYILSLFTYIRARQVERFAEQGRLLISCSLFFLLALGCKENVVTLIPSLFAIEYFSLHTASDQFSRIALRTTFIATICLFIAAAYYIIDHNLLDYINSPVGNRPFSLGERLLTQPSILLFYLSLLFFPSPNRLSIDHSFPLSTSFWHPWTTLLAIIIVLVLIIFALVQRHKQPLLGFAILFFFINHLVESTIIPLEMIFEHRNYLPSMFLFLPVAIGLHSALTATRHSSRLIHHTLLASIPVILITFGLGTYTRNKVWASEESLWADAINKAPTNARPYAKLGEIYGWQKEKNAENLKTAIALFEKSLNLESPRTSFKAAIVGNIGKVYFNYGILNLAADSFQRSLDINPHFITSRFDLANTMALQGKFDQALEQIDQVIASNDQQSRFYNLKAHLLLWLDRPTEAAENTSIAMHRTMVNKERYFYNCGVALSRSGHYSQGLWFLCQALRQEPSNRRISYSLIENRLMAQAPLEAKEYAVRLVSKNSLPQIMTELKKLPEDYSAAPVNVSLITPVILEAANDALSALQLIAPHQ